MPTTLEPALLRVPLPFERFVLPSRIEPIRVILAAFDVLCMCRCVMKHHLVLGRASRSDPQKEVGTGFPEGLKAHRIVDGLAMKDPR